MTATGISQKEYLKKYLSSGGDDKKKKKRKPKANPAVNRLRIVDDDIDIHNMRPLDDDELEIYDLHEDAPQIAGIIDERPEEVKIKEKYGTKKWKVVADENDDMGVKIIDKLNPKDASVPAKSSESYAERDNDMSPPRKSRRDSETENTMSHGLGSSPARSNHHKYDSDESPPRKNRKESISNSPVNKRGQKHESDESPPRKSRRNDSENIQTRKYQQDFDVSPPRKNRKGSSEDISLRRKDQNNISETPPRKCRENNLESINQGRKKQYYDSDESPPRKKKMGVLSPKRRQNNDSDESPPRRKKKSNTGDSSPHMKGQKYDSDASPPRRNRKNSLENSQSHKHSQKYDSDESPPRKAKRRFSESPPRKDMYSKSFSRTSYKKEGMLPRGGRYEISQSSRMKGSSDYMGRKARSDSDESPPRRQRRESMSPANRGRARDIVSPPKRDRERKRSSKSPVRNRKGRDEEGIRKKSRWGEADVSRNVQRDSLRYRTSPDRNKDRSGGNSHRKEFDDDLKRDGKNIMPQKRSELDSSPPRRIKQTANDDSKKQTLDGRKAGLVGADELKAEIANLRHREKEMFEKMDASVSGRGAAPIMRDRKTGKKRDLEEEAREKQKKDEKQAERDAKYMQWGKGLKQVTDKAQKMEEDLYEMSKPLARYADDEDLDKHLRDQEREGDPMLEYIRSKSKSEGYKGKPRYEGSFMPNRFGVRPGYRWDGVDRSNGYEKQWFETQNAKKAVEEEAYKWSTSDM